MAGQPALQIGLDADAAVSPQMNSDLTDKVIAPFGLMQMGGFRLLPKDGFETRFQSLVLLGPGLNFWQNFQKSPESQDSNKDPVDRWSLRVVTELAKQFNGQALFPFGGPPYQPFIAWAIRSGRAYTSPVGILVHDTAGLFVSYRGAVLLSDKIEFPASRGSPCLTCEDKPCVNACPVGALSPAGYDVPACHDFLDLVAGEACMTQGCAVRRSCPVSISYGRMPEQSAHHMSYFHPLSQK